MSQTITVNGRATVTASIDLAALLEDQGYGAARVATAVNGVFVPASMRAKTEIKAGDTVEIVSARQGG